MKFRNTIVSKLTILAALCAFQTPVLAQTQIDSIAQVKVLRLQVTDFLKSQSGFKSVSQIALSPDGKYLAWNISGTTQGGRAIYIASLQHPDKPVQVTAASVGQSANESEPVWSPDSKSIAFLSDEGKKGQLQLFVAAVNGLQIAKAQQYSNFKGYVSRLQWSPNGQSIGVLYVDNATRNPSPVAAKGKTVGVIDSLGNHDVQQLALINLADKKQTTLSPKGVYVFEYDWSPDNKKVAYLASLPPGDDNWYIAKLYKQAIGTTQNELIYQPAKQIALPRWSPDGKQIAFIEGLMSDQGVTGGEVFTVNESGIANAQNHTPGRKSSPAWFNWQADGTLIFTEQASGQTVVNQLNLQTNQVTKLWQTTDAIRAGRGGSSLSIVGKPSAPTVALIRSSWNKLPDVWAGKLSAPVQLTNFNPETKLPQLSVANVEWDNENWHVQGWLQYPVGYDSTRTYPLLVNAHGGPAGTGKPSQGTAIYAQLGYFVFFPNPRGSLGQGNAFTEANRRDWGYGDLRDILTGVDAVKKKVNIDNNRIGLFGWSYGGSTAMFAITQTQRFKAVVAGAGAADWLSYYGQNSIDKWMKPYFGASPYDDPAIYARSSAMTFIKNIQTPVLILVGELDGESPPAQSLQYWHALKELGKPAQLVIYEGEGHAFIKPEDRVDVLVRSLEWFKKYLPATK